ncbi:hypothetical protein AMTRI_Chr02g263130 [Amborella trichopoda]
MHVRQAHEQAFVLILSVDLHACICVCLVHTYRAICMSEKKAHACEKQIKEICVPTCLCSQLHMSMIEINK